MGALQYLADQLTLFQPGEGILSPPIPTGPTIFFSPSGITDYLGGCIYPSPEVRFAS
jgi:hypothetical protein